MAWFEPDHYIVERNGAVLRGAFAAMHWAILTPRGSLHWDGER